MNVILNDVHEARGLDNIPQIGHTHSAEPGKCDPFEGVRFGKSENSFGYNAYKEDIEAKAFASDVLVKSDAFVVMGTVTGQDVSGMLEEGFNPSEMTPEEGVNTVEHIKATLAKAGKVIEGYNDDLPKEVLAEVAGSEALAETIRNSFHENDIPITKENVNEVMDAVSLAGESASLSDAQKKFMVENGMDPTIMNIYKALHSAGAGEVRQSFGYYSESGLYYSRKADSTDIDSLKEQMNLIIEKAGLPINDTTYSQAKKLVEEGVPLTSDTLLRVNEIETVTYPIEKETAVRAACIAMGEGKHAAEGKLSGESKSLYQKAREIRERFFGDEEEKKLVDITARRQLEEVRLHMTGLVSVRLLKRGISIETEKLENLVDELKKEEIRLGKELFKTDDAAEALGKYDSFRKTQNILGKIPFYPVDITARINGATLLKEAEQEGDRLLNDRYKGISEYEKLLTPVRKDLGDSIAKAFRNVDEILKNMDLPLTEDNRKAVRALSYNETEITTTAIEASKEANLALERIVNNLTPERTIRLIRDNRNPLEMSLSELEKILTDMNRGKADESYSEFLLRLERKGDIDEKERETYIGIYRLFDKVEKSDGAVLSQLLAEGEELSVRGLLRSVRTLARKKKGLDISVSDEKGSAYADFGEKRIDTQIEGAFRPVSCMIMSTAMDMLPKEDFFDNENENTGNNQTPPKELVEEHLQEMRNLADIDSETVSQLLDAGMPATIENLNAANMLFSQQNVFRSLHPGREEKFRKLREILESPETSEEEMKEAAGEFDGDLSHALSEMKEEAVDFASYRNILSMTKQLNIAKNYLREEHYALPMEIEGELSTVHLTLKRGAESGLRMQVKTGKRDVTCDLLLSGNKAAGSISSSDGDADYEALLRGRIDSYLEENAGKFTENIQNSSIYKLAKAVIAAM